MVERVLIAPPESRIGVITADERNEVISRTLIKSTYETTLDRESAVEILLQRQKSSKSELETKIEKKTEKAGPTAQKQGQRQGQRQGMFETTIKSMLRTAGSQLGREIMRGILGSITRR